MKEISQEQAEAIFREHSSYVFRIALFLSKSPTLAEDITQDTFLQVFRKYNSYDPAKPIMPWIYKITLNITRKVLRKQKWLHLVKEIPTNEGLNYVEDEILKNEMDKELWNEINKLTLKSQEIIVLHYYLDLKLNEIAATLGIPLGTCKSRLNTALSSLGKQLRGNKFSIASKGEELYERI